MGSYYKGLKERTFTAEEVEQLARLDVAQRSLFAIWDALMDLDFHLMDNDAIDAKCSPEMEEVAKLIRHSDEIESLQEKFLDEYNKMRFIEVE